MDELTYSNIQGGEMQTVKAEVITALRETIVEHLRESYKNCVQGRADGMISMNASLVVYDGLRESDIIGDCTRLVVKMVYGEAEDAK